MLKAIKYILYIFKSLFSVIEMIPAAVGLMINAIGIMPMAISGLCVAALAILVVYAVIGRGS